MDKRRIVVTGLGLVSPLGLNVSTSWEKLLKGESGIRNITRFDASDLPCRVVGEIIHGENGFLPENYIEPRDIIKMDIFIQYAMAAAKEAVLDAGLDSITDEQRSRTGVTIGSGIGGLNAIEKNVRVLYEQSPRKVSPFFLPSSLINLMSGHVSIKYGFSGPNHAVVTACATGAHAIGDAARMIKYGDADIMVAGGSEAAICKIGITGFCALKALSTSYNNNPAIASRPWDKGRDGFVMGEGAGIIVLEEYNHAKARGAKIYAELAGYGLSGDAYHITNPHAEGLGVKKAIESSIRDAGINIHDIDYINAHATSTPVGDLAELVAVQNLFYDIKPRIMMSSSKGAIGHLLGAAGSVESIFSILAIKDQIAPPTINLDNPMDEARIDLIPKTAKEARINNVLSNSFAFGGSNASLVFRKI